MKSGQHLAVSDQQLAEARREGEREAIHVRNAVLVIDISVVAFVIGCAAVILVVLFRG